MTYYLSISNPTKFISLILFFLLQPNQIGMTWQYTIEWHDTLSGGSASGSSSSINSNSKSIVMVSSKPRSQSENQLISVKAWTTELNSSVNQTNPAKIILAAQVLKVCELQIQLKSDETAWLLNKLYVNEVTLTGQNPPLKYCQPLELLTQFKRRVQVFKC